MIMITILVLDDDDIYGNVLTLHVKLMDLLVGTNLIWKSNEGAADHRDHDHHHGLKDDDIYGDVLTLHVKPVNLLPKRGTEFAPKQPAINHTSAPQNFTTHKTTWSDIWWFWGESGGVRTDVEEPLSKELNLQYRDC